MASKYSQVSKSDVNSPSSSPPVSRSPSPVNLGPLHAPLPPSRSPSPTPPSSPIANFVGGKHKLDAEKLHEEIKKHPKFGQLTPNMIRVIEQRNASGQRHYNLSNTIESLVTGKVEAKPPPAPGSKKLSRRNGAGYINPKHDDENGLEILERDVKTPVPKGASAAKRKAHLLAPQRHFLTYTPTHTQPAVIVQGHSETVLGHGPVDAVDDWNDEGHKRSAAENKEHNKDPGIYHGLEERKASAKSGGKTKARYLSPSPTLDSHPSHYRRDHEAFNPKVPWHTYANQADVETRTRYVSPPRSSAPVPTSPSSRPDSPISSDGSPPISMQQSPQFASFSSLGSSPGLDGSLMALQSPNPVPSPFMSFGMPPTFTDEPPPVGGLVVKPVPSRPNLQRNAKRVAPVQRQDSPPALRAKLGPPTSPDELKRIDEEEEGDNFGGE